MEANGSTATEVVVTLTGSEALVLSNALALWEADGAVRAMEPATRRVFEDLTAALEPTVGGAFSSDYEEQLRAAQDEVLRT